MALFSVNYGSDVMNKYMGMNVILPEGDEGIKDGDGKFAVIYLLHGYTDDYTKWCRLTSIERYANERGIAVVMPDAGKSFYADMAHGDPYFTYLTEEVPAYVQKWFPISGDPAHTYVAGLSMGGYGAMKMALTYPERFKAAASFSGALAMAEMANSKVSDDAEPWLKRTEIDVPLAFGDVTKIAGGPNDVFWLASQAKDSGKILPDLYIACGTDDFIFGHTTFFANHLKTLGIPFKYHDEAAIHEWGYWDREVDLFLAWVSGSARTI